MAGKLKYFHDAIPDRLAHKRLFYWNTLEVRRLRAVKLPNYISQLVQVGAHAAASTRSPTVQKSRSTPAAIAGVQRRVLWRFTKL